MLNRIIGFSIENKLVMELFVTVIIAWRTHDVTRLQVDDITRNQIRIITAAPALDATDAETMITFSIGQSCINFPKVTKISSFSAFGLSMVTLTFDDGIDICSKSQQIGECLLRVHAAMPEGIVF